MAFYIDCTTMKIKTTGDWPRDLDTSTPLLTAATDPISFFVTINLETKFYTIEFLTKLGEENTNQSSELATTTWTFDASTKINVCAARDGTTNACTVSNFIVYAEYYNNAYSLGYASASDRIIFLGRYFQLINLAVIDSFFPLIDGPLTSLSNGINGANTGYFGIIYADNRNNNLIGDKAESPTASTLPVWDSSVI